MAHLRPAAGPPEAPHSLNHGAGCPELRPNSANQPLGPRWPATQALLSTPTGTTSAPETSGRPLGLALQVRSARYPPATCPLFVFYLPAIPPPPWALSSRCSTRAHSTRISPPRRRLAPPRPARPTPPQRRACLAYYTDPPLRSGPPARGRRQDIRGRPVQRDDIGRLSGPRPRPTLAPLSSAPPSWRHEPPLSPRPGRLWLRFRPLSRHTCLTALPHHRHPRRQWRLLTPRLPRPDSPHVPCPPARRQAFFEEFGAVKDAVIMQDRTTNRSRGFGFVVFDDSASTIAVLAQQARPCPRPPTARKSARTPAPTKTLAPAPASTFAPTPVTILFYAHTHTQLHPHLYPTPSPPPPPTPPPPTLRATARAPDPPPGKRRDPYRWQEGRGQAGPAACPDRLAASAA